MKLEKDLLPYLKPLTPIPTPMHPGGSLGNPLKCILFDVYGTLFISGTGDISTARKSVHPSEQFQILLDKFGVFTAPDLLLQTFFDEIHNVHQVAIRKGMDYPEVQIDQVWSRVLENTNLDQVRKFALEFELIANPVYPMPHLESVLAGCRKAGLLLGIISNAQFYTPQLFRWFLKADPVDLGFVEDLTLYSYRIGYAKPSPRIFELAVGRLKKLNIFPGAVLYVGNDLRNDILPAKQAGFQTALFAGDARSLRLRNDDPVCRGIRADLVITDLRQLLGHIGC